MKKLKKFDFSLFLSVMLLISTTFMSIGYAAINSITAEINGTATVNVQSGVFITDVEYFSDVDAHIAQCEINNIYGTLLDSKIYLSETNNASSVTYTITVYNRTDETYAFKGVVYDQSAYSNEDIKCEVSDINVNDTLGSNGTKTFKATFSYRNGLSTNNTLTSIVSFAFGVNHTITYNNITGSGFQSNIADGLTYTNTFTTAPYDITVSMDGTDLTKNTDFTYSGGTLTIPNVTGNLIITGVNNNQTDPIISDVDEGDEIIINPEPSNEDNYWNSENGYNATEQKYYLKRAYSGSYTSTTISREDLEWKVWDTDPINNTITLISATPTSSGLSLSSHIGYANGIFLMHDICEKLYGGTDGITARNLTSRDIKEKMIEHHGGSGFVDQNGKAIYTVENIQNTIAEYYTAKVYGNTLTVSSNNKYVPNIIEGNNIDFSLMDNEDPLISQPQTSASKTNRTSLVGMQTYFSIPKDSIANLVDTDIYNLIYPSGNSNTYWLASRSSNIVTQDNVTATSITYCFDTVTSSAMTGNPIEGNSNSTGSGSTCTFKLRPIITIDLNKINATQNPDGTWSF